VTKTVEAKAVVTMSYWVRGIMPVGFFMAGTLWFGNLVYLYLSVSFIQMLKAFTPVITMCALFVTRLETPTYKVCQIEGLWGARGCVCRGGGCRVAADTAWFDRPGLLFTQCQLCQLALGVEVCDCYFCAVHLMVAITHHSGSHTRCCCCCYVQMVLSVLGIAGGTALAAYGEVHNSVIGLCIMFASEVLEATRLVMTQLLLTGHKMGPFEGLMWMVSRGW
jgi:hypothetical protein